MESPSISTFVEAQPAVIAALKKHRERYSAIEKADRNVIVQAQKVKSLIYAFELCIDKFYRLQPENELSETDQELLRQITTGDSESWFFDYHQVQEVVQLAIVEQCAKVCEAEREHAKIKNDHRLCVELSNARDTARKQYQTMQKQEAN